MLNDAIEATFHIPMRTYRHCVIEYSYKNRIEYQISEVKNHNLSKFGTSTQNESKSMTDILKSIELKEMKRIESNKKIYKILDKELKEFIHSIQILIS